MFFAAEQKRPPVQLTILCYHHVDLPKKTNYSVSRKQFLDHLDVLARAGYKIVSLEQVDAYYAGKADIPSRSAVITFDDGNIGAYTVAYPLLKKRKIPWTLFIYPEVLNRGESKYSVTWPQVREMAENGVTIGSHSYSHHFLTSPPPEIRDLKIYKKWLKKELIFSKKEIKNKIGFPVNYFAVPFGAFDHYVYKTLKRSGYHLVLNVHGQNNNEHSDPYNLNRQIVLATDSLDIFKKKATVLPLEFENTNPADLSRICDQKPEISFVLKDKDKYKKETIKKKISGLKSYYLYDNRKVNINDERVQLHRQGYYSVTVKGEDKRGQFYSGAWLFRYDRVTPSFLLETKKK